jgi:N-acetyl-alpha-D-muramate 1-phosphate uridylyltransferase
VLYGDSYLTCDYRAVQDAFRGSGLPGLMTVYRNEGRYDSSNVEYDGGRILSYDKQNQTPRMRHIDYGLGVFDRSVFAAIPAGEVYDLARVYQTLCSAGNLAAFEVQGRFYEIGSPEGLLETAQFLNASENVS